MSNPDDAYQFQLGGEESFFDFLEAILAGVDRRAREQFLACLFELYSQIELPHEESLVIWDRAVARRRELSPGVGRPVSLQTALIDVLDSMNLLRMPAVVEYHEPRRLQVNAGTDALTGLYNRRLFDEYFQKELSRAARFDQQLTLLIMDLHRFKEVNDRYEHQKGDRALRMVARATRTTLRTSDYAFRIGGDEFAVLLPASGASQGFALGHRLRAQYEEEVNDLRGDLPLSLDFGIAVFPQDAQLREGLITIADGRLYEMKNRAAPTGEAAFQEILLAAASTPKAGAHEEKRKWERVTLAGTTAHIVWNEESPQSVPILDLSLGGVALSVDHSESFPASLSAVVHTPIQPPARVSLCKVNEVPLGGTRSRVGCVFVN